MRVDLGGRRIIKKNRPFPACRPLPRPAPHLTAARSSAPAARACGVGEGGGGGAGGGGGRQGGFCFFQAEDGIRYYRVTGVQTCALPICTRLTSRRRHTRLRVTGVQTC